MKQLILASTSVYRRELLSRLPVEFKSLAPQIDENLFKNRGMAAMDLAGFLAQMKARSLKAPGLVVIGSDQIARFAGRTLDKPGNRAKAIEQLKLMSGATHELFTSVCVWAEEKEDNFTNLTRVTFRNLSSAEIERYVDWDEPFDCSGSYKIEEAGITLVSKVETDDFTAIQGLPLIKLSQVLRDKGFLMP